MARLAEQYERGAVLAFFFADQLKGIESSGFDVANFFVDMISSLIRPARVAGSRKTPKRANAPLLREQRVLPPRRPNLRIQATQRPKNEESALAKRLRISSRFEIEGLQRS